MAVPGSAAELEGARIVDFPLRGEWMAVHTPGSRIPSHGTDMLGQRYEFDLIRFDPRKGSRDHPAGGLRTLLLGHTGNSTAPHLHFQLMDGPDPLTAHGVPCAFRAYEVWRDGGWQRVEHAIPRSTERIRSVAG